MKVPAVFAHQGNPAITFWCETCECRAVPMRDGSCGFCTAHPYKEMPTPPAPANKGKIDPTGRPGLIQRYMREHGAVTAFDLMAEFSWTDTSTRAALQSLRKMGVLERVGDADSIRGQKRGVYALVETEAKS